MLHEINVHSVMTDKALSSYFHNAGELWKVRTSS